MAQSERPGTTAVSTAGTQDSPDGTVRTPPDELFALLDDEYVRAILAEIETTAKSGGELIESCDASRATVYRRLDRLEATNWVDTTTTRDRDGPDRTLYASRLEALQIELEGSRLRAVVETT